MVVAPGLTGMTAFGVLEEQGVVVPAYQAFFADDPTGMSRLAAGLVTDPIFRITSMIQWVLAPLAVLLCIIEFRPLRLMPGWAQAIRLPLLVIALGLVIHHNAVMAPRMSEELTTYRSAAARMERPVSDAARARFDQDHRIAERLYSLRLLVLIGAVAGTAAGIASRASRAGTSGS
ncbi:MAG: hypothetical protein VX641_03055 [Planctomycetota bacterium]|nr:hypothetical protein [Planctomycetota bacterium]